MDLYSLNVSTNNIGGYFSSEQLELLSIIQCKTYEELISFVYQCKQLNGIFSKEDLQNSITQDLEQLKRSVFKSYQDTLVSHNSDKESVLNNTLYRLAIKQEDIEVIKRAYTTKNKETMKYIRDYMKARYPDDYESIFKQVHQFISTERDQNKAYNLYDEFVLINERLEMFDTLLVGSGKPDVVINELFEEDNKDKFDFYFAKRDLDFALKNNKHIRFHSLLTKGANEKLFDGRTKEEILETLTTYVKATIDFVNEYNSTHKLADGTPVINSMDLFNEIVSFNKNAQGKYENIWETKYGITIQDICNIFAYAKEHKPEGVSYLYNEPFLEDTERRKKVIEVLESINTTSNGLIDTLGSQMHITFETSDEQIQECFRDFKTLQNTQGINIQITEFDLSLSERETLKTIGSNPHVSYEQIYAIKRNRIDSISSIINNSGVRLKGVTYWSLTDNIDCNLERVRTNLLNKGVISDINQIPTVCGGLIPTSQQYINTLNNNTNENSNNNFTR
ncbi:MAG: endo-1,4-beta-xylanase [Bacilli bacterium]